MNLKSIETKLRTIEAAIVSLIANNKLLFIGLILPLLILKFKSMIVDLILAGAKKDMSDTIAKTTVLQNQETKENTQADQIIQKADQDRANEQAQPIADDWFKNDGNNGTQN